MPNYADEHAKCVNAQGKEYGKRVAHRLKKQIAADMFDPFEYMAVATGNKKASKADDSKLLLN